MQASLLDTQHAHHSRCPPSSPPHPSAPNANACCASAHLRLLEVQHVGHVLEPALEVPAVRAVRVRQLAPGAGQLCGLRAGGGGTGRGFNSRVRLGMGAWERLCGCSPPQRRARPTVAARRPPSASTPRQPPTHPPTHARTRPQPHKLFVRSRACLLRRRLAGLRRAAGRGRGQGQGEARHRTRVRAGPLVSSCCSQQGMWLALGRLVLSPRVKWRAEHQHATRPEPHLSCCSRSSTRRCKTSLLLAAAASLCRCSLASAREGGGARRRRARKKTGWLHAPCGQPSAHQHARSAAWRSHRQPAKRSWLARPRPAGPQHLDLELRPLAATQPATYVPPGHPCTHPRPAGAAPGPPPRAPERSSAPRRPPGAPAAPPGRAAAPPGWRWTRPGPRRAPARARLRA